MPGNPDDLRISFASGDEVIVTGGLADDPSTTVERVIFSDASFLTISDVLARLLSDQATDGDDNIIGTSFADTLDGGLGNDTLSGRDGEDVYVFAPGDGADVIDDLGGGSGDLVQVAFSFSSANLTRPDLDGNDIVLDYGNGDVLTVIGALETNGASAIEEYDFLGFTGPEDFQDMRQAVLDALSTDGDDYIAGFDGRDTLRGGLGDDTLKGGEDSDRYVYEDGDGQDFIEDSGGLDVLTINGYNGADAQFLIHSPENPTWLRIVLKDADEIVLVHGLSAVEGAGIETVDFINSLTRPSEFTDAPEIIRNDNGFDIDFDILGSELNGEGITPRLTVDFGDLAGGDVTTASWFYTAEYQGRFNNIEASFSHVNALGENQSSQIASVEVHDLIGEVQADRPGDDDLLRLPDALYLSDGGQEAVETVVGTASDPLSNSLDVVTISAELVDCWSYVRSLDPAMGDYRVLEITRSDGSMVSKENYWRTDRTFYMQGEPEYEDVLHILDYQAAGQSGTYSNQYVSLGDLFGSNGRDQLNGDAQSNTISALAGKDLIAPGLGSNVILTGSCDDKVSCTAEELGGDTTNDLAVGDKISIEEFTDEISASQTTNGAALEFNGGMLQLFGDFEDASFEVRAVDGQTTVQLAGSGVTRLTSAGERFFSSDSGENRVYGDTGDDVIGTGAGADLLSGGGVVADFTTDFEAGVDRIELFGFVITGLDDLDFITVATSGAINLGGGAFIVFGRDQQRRFAGSGHCWAG